MKRFYSSAVNLRKLIQDKKYQEVVNLFESGTVPKNSDTSKEYIVAVILQTREKNEKLKQETKQSKEQKQDFSSKIQNNYEKTENTTKIENNQQNTEEETTEEKTQKKTSLIEFILRLVFLYYIFNFFYQIFNPKPKK